MSLISSFSRSDAIARYTQIAGRLPAVKNPPSTRRVEHLGELVDDIDVFVLDGFGVLNVGDTTVPGAVERVAALQKMGKQVLVLTNGATVPVEKTIEKYAKWGMDFAIGDVISSRNALEQALLAENKDILWGVVGTEFAQVEKLAPKVLLLADDENDYERVDGFIFLSAMQWTDARQAMLRAALKIKKRPLLVGNPDLVAPWPKGMSMEPGLFAHQLADEGVCEPQFYGKPFANVFDIAVQRVADKVEPNRIAMVGDTLHTDILGGSSYGWRTVLIKNHGLMKEADDESAILQAGIRPDFIAATT